MIKRTRSENKKKYKNQKNKMRRGLQMIKKFGDKVKSYMVLAGAAAILILVIVCSVQINKNNKDQIGRAHV